MPEIQNAKKQMPKEIQKSKTEKGPPAASLLIFDF